MTEAVKTPIETERNPEDWVTEHFSWAEMTRSQKAVTLGLKNIPNDEERANIKQTCELLEKIRSYLCAKYDREVKIKVTSGFRSQRVNRAVGGSPTSAHLSGFAADIRASGLTSVQLAKDIHEMEAKRLIKYDQLILEYPERGERSWVHIGLRKGTHREQELTISSRGKLIGLIG